MTLQPAVQLMAEEATAKLVGTVLIDTLRPLLAFEVNGRALAQLIEATGRAKELGLTPEELAAALKAINLGGGDDLQ